MQRVDVCRANLRHFSCRKSLDSIVTQDEKYVFYNNPAKQLVWVRAGDPMPTYLRGDEHGDMQLLSFWVCAHGPAYWRLFPKKTMMDFEAIVNKIEEVDQRLAVIRPQRFKKLILFDNATPHRAKVTTQKLAQLRYVRVPHPPYSPDISPCDYHFFLSLQDFLAGKDTRSQADLESHINEWINSRPKQFWRDGIRKLAERWQQVIDFNGEYILQHR
ncbi:hypothetical protein Q1695_005266 [Nippostrongylus brasiliensis]|nr:hypothetical protein Q1695_005266 [Nippostrongylus brasiliensis]